MRIGELARRTGKSVATLRYYEQLGLLLTPERTESGYRDYLPDMVERVRFIGQAQERGFSLEEIATVLALHDQGQAPCGCVVETTRRKIIHLEKLIAEMQERQAALSYALRRWESGEAGDGPFCPILTTTATYERRVTEMARKVEVFTAGCPLCEPVVDMVQRLACPNCDVTIHNLRDDPQAAQRAREAGVQRVPMVLVDGKPAECCQVGQVTEEGLRAAGIGA
jgi:DNA-binding transcriptional MerR regulator